MFRAGDIVHHRPSGERWMLACDEYQGEVVCCGWPETFAKASDCELRHAANDADRRTILADVSRHHDTIRGRRAYSQLVATMPKVSVRLDGRRFRKRPVEIDAVPWTGLNLAEVEAFVGRRLLVDETQCLAIETLEGILAASVGDWVIRGVKGEYYPCKPDIFAATYEEVPRGK